MEYLKNTLKYFKIILVTICLTVLLYESYFQVKDYRAKKNAGGETVTSSTYLDKGHYWKYPENQEFIFTNEDGETIKLKSDRLGFRNFEAKSHYDVLLIGDSFINAVNTVYEKTLAYWLNEAGVTTYNGGIDGVGTIHEYYIIRDILKEITPKVVVINFYLGNDFRDNFFCQEINPELVFKESKESEVLPSGKRGSVAEASSVSETSSVSEIPLSTHIKARINNIINRSHVLKLVYQKFYLPRKHNALSSMSYYGRSEVSLIAYDKANPNPEMAKAIQKTDDALKAIKAMLNKKGIPLIVVGIPSKGQVLKSFKEFSTFDIDPGLTAYFMSLKDKVDFDKPDILLSDLCQQNGIKYVSLLKPFRAKREDKIFYHVDSHWTWVGQQLAGQIMLPYIRSMLNDRG